MNTRFPAPPSGARAGRGEAILAAVAAVTEVGLLSGWGQSRLGRSIVGGQFSAAAPRSDVVRLMVVGGVHGDELASVEAVLELTGRLADPAPDSALSGVEVSVLPVLNPDGLALSLKNASSDVDLNRNFPAKNFSREHAPGYDPGPAPLSEPETALLARIFDERAIMAVVAVHAPFACVNFDGPALPWARAVAAVSGWPVRENIGYPTPGSLGSWLGVDRNVPVLTLELPPGPLADFREQAAAALDTACAAAATLFS